MFLAVWQAVIQIVCLVRPYFFQFLFLELSRGGVPSILRDIWHVEQQNAKKYGVVLCPHLKER